MLKIKFTDSCDTGFDQMTLDILREHFGEVQVCNDPDFVFCAQVGHDFLKYDAVRIWFTGENIRPDFNLVDYAIGFDYMDFGDRYKRIPLYHFYVKDYERAMHKHEITDEEIAAKTAFCNFIFSNPSRDGLREKYFEELSKYKRVDSPGKMLHNCDPIGPTAEDKHLFQKNYKFSFAFENSSTPGYSTEKILQAFAAGTIPIYYGDPRIASDFNEKAFINVHAYNSMDEVIAEIKRIDSDDEVYKAYLREPIWAAGGTVTPDPLEEYKKFIISICSQSPGKARRLGYSDWERRYRDTMTDYYFPKQENIFKKIARKITGK